VLEKRNVLNGVEPILGVIGSLLAGTPTAFEAVFGRGWLAGLLEDYGFARTWCIRCGARRSPRHGWRRTKPTPGSWRSCCAPICCRMRGSPRSQRASCGRGVTGFNWCGCGLCGVTGSTPSLADHGHDRAGWVLERPGPRVKILTQLLDMGPFIALVILVEVGDVRRFDSRRLASWAGLAPAQAGAGWVGVRSLRQPRTPGEPATGPISSGPTTSRLSSLPIIGPYSSAASSFILDPRRQSSLSQANPSATSERTGQRISMRVRRHTIRPEPGAESRMRPSPRRTQIIHSGAVRAATLAIALPYLSAALRAFATGVPTTLCDRRRDLTIISRLPG
jgi:Transposase IS116/IS110/IS902 family